MAKKKKNKVKKKFVTIGKIGNNPQGGAICFKHWTNNILVYLYRTSTKYKFHWINFYYNTGENKGDQFASWTAKRGLHDNYKPSKK
jgi:hypothetical protein